jgi:subtilisin family serine protease
MRPLDVVRLTPLMELTSGSSEIAIGLIDGAVATNLSDLASENIRELSGELQQSCSQVRSTACMHGTFVAGILCARRNSAAPAICPDCTLLVRPIFIESVAQNGEMVSATPEELATAIIESIDAGARVLNLSVALSQPSSRGERQLEQALSYATRRGVLVVVAAGNQGSIGSSTITRHPWVIPVAACDLSGRAVSYTNLGNSIGRRGLCAPGDGVTSLGADGQTLTFGGTSAAAPFVTGAIALLWSLFPAATAAEIKIAVIYPRAGRRTTVVPPLLDAWATYQVMSKSHGLRKTS